MAYYVLGPGGAKYGPAELKTLNLWVSEGKITPETLLEDIGSGVKMPARAIRGLAFPGMTVPTPAVATSPAAPSVPGVNSIQSNYIRPGLGTGGSSRNLFLPNVDSKWALHGFLSAGGGIACGIATILIMRFAHFEIGKFTFLAFGLCIYGARCGYNGMNQGDSSRGALVIAANVVAFIFVCALVIWSFATW